MVVFGEGRCDTVIKSLKNRRPSRRKVALGRNPPSVDDSTNGHVDNSINHLVQSIYFTTDRLKELGIAPPFEVSK